MVAAVIAPPVVPDQLETLLRRLLSYSAYWRECRHWSPLRHPRQGLPTWRPCCSACFRVCRGRPGPLRRDWATIVCFSCGTESGHGVGRCPELDETFPIILPGWSAEKVGGNYVMVSPRVEAERRRAENGDWSGEGGGGGSTTWISNALRPPRPRWWWGAVHFLSGWDSGASCGWRWLQKWWCGTCSVSPVLLILRMIVRMCDGMRMVCSWRGWMRCLCVHIHRSSVDLIVSLVTSMNDSYVTEDLSQIRYCTR